MRFENLIALSGFRAIVTRADPGDRISAEVVAEGELEILDKEDGIVVFTVGGKRFRFPESQLLPQGPDMTVIEFMTEETGEVYVLDVDSESLPRT